MFKKNLNFISLGSQQNLMSGEPSDERNKRDSVGLQDNIEIELVKQDYYVEFPVSGIRGGLTRRNDFRMDMFTEFVSSPRGQKYELTENGEISGLKELGEYAIVRNLHATGVATPENAFYFGLWMIAQVLGVSENQLERLIREEYNV